mmetsp:Transcript_4696/g.13315  ORF Transcript_4696/g.13315 Transcript_4696/m.13315 type:complete len:214 (+) Transcript_4696:124-765(+)
MDVLPTPASPTRTGLFLVRRPRMRMVWTSCSSRPTRGSSWALRAMSVRSLPYFMVTGISSSAASPGMAAEPTWPALCASAPASPRSLARCAPSTRTNSPLRAFGEALLQSLPSSRHPLPFSCCSTESSRCEVSTAGLPRERAHSTVSSRARLDAPVNGARSVPWAIAPRRPRRPSSSARASARSTPRCWSTRPPSSEPSATTPTTSISVPTRS